METVAVTGTIRTEVGKKATKAIRKAGLVPCVIYGGEGVIHFSSTSKAFKNLIFTPEFKLVEITLDGTSYKCILKDAQYHPVSDEIVHLDFLQLIDDQKIIVNIPVAFRGVSPGVKAGGKLVSKLRTIKVKTTPDQIVNQLFVDISNVKLGGSVRVRDIEITDGMQVMNPSATPVASVETPRALKSATAEAETEVEASPAAEEVK